MSMSGAMSTETSVGSRSPSDSPLLIDFPLKIDRASHTSGWRGATRRGGAYSRKTRISNECFRFLKSHSRPRPLALFNRCMLPSLRGSCGCGCCCCCYYCCFCRSVTPSASRCRQQRFFQCSLLDRDTTPVCVCFIRSCRPGVFVLGLHWLTRGCERTFPLFTDGLFACVKASERACVPVCVSE